MLNHVPRGSVMPPDGPNGRKGYGFGLGAAVARWAPTSGSIPSMNWRPSIWCSARPTSLRPRGVSN